MNPIIEIMKGMISVLNEASNAYYNTGNPIMTDKQFDVRLGELKELEEETGIVFANSPTINVGAKVLNELNEVEHNHLMLSLEKCHTVDELVKFANNKELVASIKLDGMTVSLLYEDGTFIKAETRGNGHVGSDVTEHIRQFKNVPYKINKKGTYIIDGEAIITDDDFEEVNKNGEFKNSRNTIAGTLSSLDTSVVSQRRAKFVAWDVIEGGNSNNLSDNLKEAEELNFDVVPHWEASELNPKTLQPFLDFVFDYATDMGFPNDGIVFKFNDIKYGKSLGATSHHFRNGIAYKAQDETAETTLKYVEWSIGKTGVLSPVAIFDPVELNGSTISRATLHNISIVKDLELSFGDTITVCKANDVIPAVSDNLDRTLDNPVIPPSICPICGGKTEIKKDNNSEVLVCTNPDCKGKLLGKLTHFVSKNAMNIDGLSEATLEKFIELDFVNSFIDIYELKHNFCEDIIKLDGFGKKSVSKLMESIEKSKHTTLDKFIYSLSIPLIGRSASKTIAKYFNYDFDRFYREGCLNNFDYKQLDDFGRTMAESMQNYLDEDISTIEELAEYMTFEIPNAAQNNVNISGKTFVITGSLEHFSNRDELKDKIEMMGGKVSGSISKKTDYLINNDINSTTGKNKKAKHLGVSIITEEEFLNMLN